MIYTPVPHVATADLYTAANYNTYISDNFAATVPDIFTAAGDTPYATGADAVTRLAIGAAGRLYRVNAAANAPEWRQAYQCRVYHNASQAPASAAALAFNSERFDTDTMHDTSSNNSRITFTHAGTYLVGFNGRVDTTADGAGGFGIRLNGSTLLGRQIAKTDNGNAGEYFSLATLYQFSAADYVECLVYFSGSLTGVTSVSAETPEFWAIEIG